MGPSSSSTCKIKEQFVPEENRDIASFNADNEFNRAIDEENIDFNHSRSAKFKQWKRSHDVNVQNLIQKIENNPQRQALQSDFKQHRQFNPFSKESQDVIKQLEALDCVNYSMLNPTHSAKHACRSGTSASSTACVVTSYEMMRQRTRSTSSQFLIFSSSRTFTSGKANHMVTSTERKKVIKNTTLRISSKRNVRNENS